MFARFYDRDGEPHAALIVRHEDETCCVADMDAAGRVSRGLSFVVCMETSFAPCADGSGRVAMAYSYDGEAGVLLVKPGTDEAPEKVVIEGVTSDASPILMPLEDGSVVVGGQQESGGGYLARINALGETMFAVSIDDPPDRMAVTPSGFVLHMMQLNRLYDFDEDGNLLGIREVEYERDPYMEVLEDMANLGGETALLMDAESVGGSRAEIVFAPGEGISVPDDEYSHALYHESGCALQDVWPQESGVLALIERSDGQRVGLSIDADGGVQEVEAPEPRERNRQAVSRRHAVVERGAGRRGGDAGRWAGPRNLACAHDDPYRGRQARMALRTGTAGRELCPRRTIPHRGRRGAGTGGYDGGHWAGRRAAARLSRFSPARKICPSAVCAIWSMTRSAGFCC